MFGVSPTQKCYQCASCHLLMIKRPHAHHGYARIHSHSWVTCGPLIVSGYLFPLQHVRVGILDKNVKLVRRRFIANRDLLHFVPLLDTLGEVLTYASNQFFEPPLGSLIPFEYTGKQGVGTPKPISPTTSVVEMIRRLKHRRVSLKKITFYGLTDLGKCLDPLGLIIIF